MEAVLVILVSLTAAVIDMLWRQRPKSQGRHAKGREGTYYVMQRQFVRRRLQGKIRVYIPQGGTV
jgi:hypothetical protein